MKKTTVKNNSVLIFNGIYDSSKVLLVSNKERNSLSFANYDNDTEHMENPWTLFMEPDEAKEMAKAILAILK